MRQKYNGQSVQLDFPIPPATEEGPYDLFPENPEMYEMFEDVIYTLLFVFIFGGIALFGLTILVKWVL